MKKQLQQSILILVCIMFYSCFQSPSNKPNIWYGDQPKSLEYKEAKNVCSCTYDCLISGGYNANILVKSAEKIDKDVEKVLEGTMSICQYFKKWDPILNQRLYLNIVEEQGNCSCDTAVTVPFSDLDFSNFLLGYSIRCKLAYSPFALETNALTKIDLNEVEKILQQESDPTCRNILQEFILTVQEG